jgi:hypothetical protein
MVVPPTRSTSTDSAPSNTSAEKKPPKKITCTTVPAAKGAGAALATLSTSPPLTTEGKEESMEKSEDDLDIRSAEDVKAEEKELLDLEPKEPEEQEAPVLPGPTEAIKRKEDSKSLPSPAPGEATTWRPPTSARWRTW